MFVLGYLCVHARGEFVKELGFPRIPDTLWISREPLSQLSLSKGEGKGEAAERLGAPAEMATSGSLGEATKELLSR